MVKKKRTSKRMKLSEKYKIQAKVREHHRKLRREAKKNPDARKKLKKDPGIPNLWPLKEEFLQKIQMQKEKLEQEKVRQREARSRETAKKRSMASLAEDASKRAKEFEKKEEDVRDEVKRTNFWAVKETSRRAYFKEFKKILETSDVVLEVLDARDPLGSRCPDIEKKILQKDPNKKIILILNKIDLVPKENVQQWLKYLRNEFPTIAFKSTTQEQRKKLSQSTVSADLASKNLLQSSECIGADILIQLLKNYCRNNKIKTSISVGIIGYPNVGKSSLINSLKRSKAVGVGATPGFTKTTQEIYLDKNVRLIDCPGIVFANNPTDNDIILRNCVKIEQIPDPIEPVETILKRCRQQQLIEIYKIPEFKNSNEFLLHIGRKRGKLGKGGVPDLKASARSILQDWNTGRIPFYTVPPAVENVHVSAEIVSQWGKEFDIEALLSQESSVLSALPSVDTKNLMMMDAGHMDSVTSGFLNDEEMHEDVDDDDEEDEEFENEDDEENDDMEDDSEINDGSMETASNLTETPNPEDLRLLLKEKKQVSLKKQNLADAQDIHNPQINKNMKKQQKKLKKQQKKKSRTGVMEDDDDYDTWSAEYDAKQKSKTQDEPYNFNSDFVDDNDDTMQDDDINLNDV